MERVVKLLSQDLMIRVSAAVTTEIVAGMCATQNTGPTASIALGRALTGALLMASQLRETQRIGLHFNGDGPLGWIFAEATYEAQARGYCQHGSADVPLKNGRIDVAGGVGRGLLTVTRSAPFYKQPHSGIVPIETGEISPDIAHYLFQSHQVPSIVALAVSLDENGEVSAAGGVLVEVMPGATERLIETLEARAAAAPPLSQSLRKGLSPLEFAKFYTHDSPLIEREHPHTIAYVCRCNRDRVDRALLLSGRAALSEMILKGDPVPVTCQFCGRAYTVGTHELRDLLFHSSDPN